MTDTYPERVAEIKKNKSRDGYGPALAKIFDELPDEQKPSFVFEAKEIDPLRTAFGAGHAATSTLLTVGTTVPAIIEGMIRFDAALNPLSFSAGCVGMWSGIMVLVRASEHWRGRSDLLSQYRMMDIEYAMWRMAQVEKGEIAPIKALGAGLLNGFKHNAVSMTCRWAATAVVGMALGVTKGAIALSRGIFGSADISKITHVCQKASKAQKKSLAAICGKSYGLVYDKDISKTVERLVAIREAAHVRSAHRHATLGPDA